MEEFRQTAQYLAWTIGLVLMPFIQNSKEKKWWPKKGGAAWDPRPLLFGLSFVILFGVAYFYADFMTIAQVKEAAGDVLTESAKATTAGVLAHFGWQKIRGPFKQIGKLLGL